MTDQITLEITYDGEWSAWKVGALVRHGGVIELCRSSELGPYTTWTDVRNALIIILDTWAVPPLGAEASESLHDVWCSRFS